MPEKTKCPPPCGHERTSHSIFGCMERGCSCTKTYMDLSPRRK